MRPMPINAAATRSFAPLTLPVKREVVSATPADLRNCLRAVFGSSMRWILPPRGALELWSFSTKLVRHNIFEKFFKKHWTTRSEKVTLDPYRSEEHTSELQSLRHLVCR